MVPEGLRYLLNWIRDEYNNPEIIITENGFSDTGEIDDQGRINYYQVKTNRINEINIFQGRFSALPERCLGSHLRGQG